MVNDHYPYEKWLFHWEYTLFSDIPIWVIACYYHGSKHGPSWESSSQVGTAADLMKSAMNGDIFHDISTVLQ